MATDVEESDTEYHERPAPPKRQCTQVENSYQENHDQMLNDIFNQVHQVVQQDEEDPIDNESEYERDERLIREKLRRWQACQIAKGFVDNTINRVMENYIMGTHADPSQLRLFRGTELEDTAVMMAITNHGLVHPGQFDTLVNDSELWASSDMLQNLSDPPNLMDFEESKNINNPVATSSSKIFPVSPPTTFNQETKDKPEDGDQQDFLERAVAEAIKIKGLSALSVDYG